MPESPLPKIHGIIAYPVTPFATDSAATIDTERLSALVDRLVVSGVHAIAPLGSTGELAYLDEAEFDTVVDTTIAAVDGRVPVVVGVSDLTTAKTSAACAVRATGRRRYGDGLAGVLLETVGTGNSSAFSQHWERDRDSDHDVQQPGHKRGRYEPGTVGPDV